MFNNERRESEKSEEFHLNHCNACFLPIKNSIIEDSIPELKTQVLRCTATACYKCKGFLIMGKFYTIHEILQKQGGSHGWRKVDTIDERRILFVLIQIHNESVNDVQFTLPPITDFVKIFWTKNGEAVGFYSIKTKGTFDFHTMSSYTMDTLDTIFIRSSYRRRGFALEALTDLRKEFPSVKIGFSYPLSPSMRLVIWKHLKETMEDRPRFWETTGSYGTHGNSRNLWLTLQRQKSTLIIPQNQNKTVLEQFANHVQQLQ